MSDVAGKHPFTTDGYVHGVMLGSVDCTVCGKRIGDPAHIEPFDGLPPLDEVDPMTDEECAAFKDAAGIEELLLDLTQALCGQQVLGREIVEAEAMNDRGEVGCMLSDGSSFVLRLVHIDMETI